ncbi:MAG: hypothetical protein V3T58_07000 [Candidatus Hydrothermarchaeales archaeon]
MKHIILIVVSLLVIGGCISGGEVVETPTPKTDHVATPHPAATALPDINTSTRVQVIEPSLVIPKFEGSKTIELSHLEPVQIGGALIYLDFDPKDCSCRWTWDLRVLRPLEDGWVYEGEVSYVAENVEPYQDITDAIHRETNALDNYIIIVEEWSENKLNLTLTYES